MTTRALVLGGGGIAGFAWAIGLLVGLVEAGIDVGNADLFVGTSAGATVAAQITSGIPSWVQVTLDSWVASIDRDCLLRSDFVGNVSACFSDHRTSHGVLLMFMR